MVRFVLASPREGVDTLPIRAAAYQRFDISPDGLRIAGVVEGLEGSELWVFDTQSGSQQKWIAALESMVFMEPSWAPGGTRLAIGVQNRDRLTEGFVLMGSPDLGNPPDTLSKLLAWQVVFAQDGQDLLATDGDKIWTMRPEPGAPTVQ
jgi:Tol biopolymer transport system component